MNLRACAISTPDWRQGRGERPDLGGLVGPGESQRKGALSSGLVGPGECQRKGPDLRGLVGPGESQRKGARPGRAGRAWGEPEEGDPTWEGW